jgi:hypothetical protein
MQVNSLKAFMREHGANFKRLTREIGSKKLVGWLRNTDRKPWALCIPYDGRVEKRVTYPDFLFVRSESGRLLIRSNF